MSTTPAPITELKSLAAETVREQQDALLGLSHDLHAHPEIRWEEHRSVEAITELLAQHSFSIQRTLGGLPTAFRARAGSGSRRIALIAEYDALEGLGHACGHNIIASASVGAALALAPLAARLDAQIEVVGTPAEEGGGGKIYLLDQGVFDGLDAAMMIHPGPDDALWARPFAVSHFDVQYSGRAAHAAAYPERGVNAADAMTVAQVAIGLLRQQLPSSVRVHGIVRNAGTAPNAIPEHAAASWYVRASGLEELDAAFDQVRACFEAGAMATGCKLTLTETSPRYSEFDNDAELADCFRANAERLGRDMDPSEKNRRGINMASTDMGNVSQRTRAIHPYLSIGSLPAVNHQKEFAAAAVTPAADRAVLDGATILASTAIDLLTGP
ncbi:M20 family metallopeptidase [Nesterenkonia populi]